MFTSADTLAVGVDEHTPLVSLDAGGRGPTRPWRSFTERYHAAYVNEVRVFLDVVAGRAANPSPPGESLVSLRLAEACEESVRTGRPVRVDGPVGATA